MSRCAEIYGIYGREERWTVESCVRPARAAKRERPAKAINPDRAAAFDGETDFDHRPAARAIGAIGAVGPRAEIHGAYGVDAIGAMAPRVQIDCAYGRAE